MCSQGWKKREVDLNNIPFVAHFRVFCAGPLKVHVARLSPRKRETCTASAMKQKNACLAGTAVHSTQSSGTESAAWHTGEGLPQDRRAIWLRCYSMLQFCLGVSFFEDTLFGVGLKENPRTPQSPIVRHTLFFVHSSDLFKFCSPNCRSMGEKRDPNAILGMYPLHWSPARPGNIARPFQSFTSLSRSFSTNHGEPSKQSSFRCTRAGCNWVTTMTLNPKADHVPFSGTLFSCTLLQPPFFSKALWTIGILHHKFMERSP